MSTTATRASLLGVLAVAVAVRIPLLGGGQIDYDEGVYWQSLRALAAGHRLFSSVYSSQPPAFLMLLLPAHLTLGGSLPAERLTGLVLALAGLVAVYRTAELLGSRWVGVAAAALLSADPLFFRESVALQADGPAISLAAIAIALAAESRSRAGWAGAGLAAAGGAVLAVGVLTKLLALAALPALAVVLTVSPPWSALRPPRARPASPLQRLAAAAAGGLAAAILVLLPFAAVWPDLWRQSVGLHLDSRSVPLGGLDAYTLLRELPLAALAALGLTVAARRWPLLALAGGAWTAAAALLLAAQHPLWPHHAVVLAPPLALLGGASAGLLQGWRPRAVGAALLLIATAAAALYVRSLQAPDWSVRPAVTALRTTTTPDQAVITDDQFAAALANRSTPPELVDTSQVRVLSGDLTAAEVERIAERSDVRAMLLATDRLVKLPGLQDWLRQHYPEVRQIDPDRKLYLIPRSP
jgi:hypothetical protein